MPVIRARYTELEALDDLLTPAIEALRAEGDSIEGPRIPGWQAIEINVRLGRPQARDQLKGYLRALFLAFLTNYRTFVDANFPTLRSHFHLYAEPPTMYFFVVGAPAQSLFDWRLTIYSLKATTNASSVAIADDVVRQGDNPSTYKIDGVEYDGVAVTWTSVADFLRRHTNFGEMHLRSLVYATIKREWRAVEDAYRKLPRRAPEM